MDFMPVGFRFRPTDEELVDHYLKHKLLGNDSNVHNVIAEVDVCKFEPRHLPALSVIKSDDPEWFFFSPRDYKYTNSKRFNRATNCGFWKATGNDRNIKTRGTNNVIGTKKTLVFYEGRVPGVKTNWVIHEYHAVTFDDSQRNFVLCRLMRKADKNTEGRTDSLICDEGESSRYPSSNCKNQATVETIPDVSSASLIDILSPVYTSDEAEPSRYMCSQASVEGIPNVGGTLPEMNLESIFQAPHQEDKYLPSSTQQSAIRIEQEGSCPNFPFLGAYFRNENNIVQTTFETIEEEDELMNSFANFRDENSNLQTLLETIEKEDKFVNSLLADEDFVFSENLGHAFVNGPTHLESLRRVCYESSDTNAEIVSTLCGNTLDASTICHEHSSSRKFHASQMFESSNGAVILVQATSECGNTLDASTVCHEHPSLGEFHALKMFKSSNGAVRVFQTTSECGNTLDASTVCHEHPSSVEFHASKMFKLSHGAGHDSKSLLSSNNDGNKDKKGTIFQDDFLGMVTSSCDSTADKPSEINCIEISSSPSSLKRRKNQYHPRSANFVSQRGTTTKRSQTPKVSSNAESHVDF